MAAVPVLREVVSWNFVVVLRRRDADRPGTARYRLGSRHPHG
ncbi:hypothetical protein [Blastococcus brunescens]|uniref:Uncharacterized protein n=1 Tax=Blastococcus brunescens TaxID=1564165 RepID=A0ABZ1AT88_9ACTN|nr:hypothetical protein [Blastococcus sp. BMG 8361]WRL61730.1 hypothetical protein U6N30_16465 [Blastococcus sp. BMG 8361]